MPKKLTPERQRELTERVAELKQALERLPADRQEAFKELLDKQTRKPARKRSA